MQLVVTAQPDADAPPSSARLKTEHPGSAPSAHPPAPQSVPSAAPAVAAAAAEPATGAGAVAGGKRRRDEPVTSASGGEGAAARAAGAATGREASHPAGAAAADEPVPKRTRVEASPERILAAARGAATGGTSPAPGTRSAGGRTRAGNAAWGAASPPQATRPAEAEFERRQLHDLPRDVRTRLLEGAPLAADQPITGAVSYWFRYAKPFVIVPENSSSE